MRTILALLLGIFCLVGTPVVEASAAQPVPAQPAPPAPGEQAQQLVISKASGAHLPGRIPPATMEEGVYLTHVSFAPGIRQCFGDIYLPPDFPTASAQKYPVVLIVHGGAWLIGSSLDPGEVDISQRLALHGYVVFTINYRLMKDGGTYPKSLEDVRDAIAYLAVHADELKIDTSRFGIYGGSAGAMLALLAAYMPDAGEKTAAPHYPKLVLPRAKAAVVYGPVTDIRNLEKTWVFNYMDDTPWHNPQLYEQASPVTYVKTAVPTLCIQGDKDITVPIEQSKELVAALQAQGIRTGLVVIPKSRHVFHEEAGPRRELAFIRLLEFFNSELKPEGEAPLQFK